MDTSLVDTGMTITVNPIQNTDYLLEITAKADGFKDYSNSLQVPAQQNVIVSLTPNPATGQVTVAYDLSNSVQIAQLTLTSATNPNNHASYMLNTKHSQAIINLGSLPIGIYVVNLSCDGQLADSKQLSIQ